MAKLDSPLQSLVFNCTQAVSNLPISPYPLQLVATRVDSTTPSPVPPKLTMSRSQKGGNTSAIFVHAGAGFHSLHNEKAHLETCENASKVAMSILKNGGSAVDAVEIAIMLLEDSEITNAGYGSNLTIDGAVECDATVVNHQGRSGAAGAVANVKNPISLARVILETSSKPLSLQRVPPNFLVGPGATDFAYEHRLVVLPDDGLVSPAARERWHRWQQDLVANEGMEKQHHGHRQSDRFKSWIRRPIHLHPAQLLSSHTNAHPPSSSPPMHETNNDPNLPPNHPNNRPRGFGVTPPADFGTPSSDSSRTRDGEYIDGMSSQPEQASVSALEETFAGSAMEVDSTSEIPGTPANHQKNDEIALDPTMDRINDTVGAVAIDCHGNIAAGSSSGGIAMKHRGRIGPAALVGIGTAVIPVDSSDPDQTSVAVVTSGTGEHIATTMAASTCASRVYYSHRKCDDGDFEEVTEEQAVRAMIASDFMEHPGVRGSHCQGAIGVMAVKKTNDGTFLYFGHNTDSFALASMCSEDKKPTSVMSRSNGNGSIAQGGRAYRWKRYKVAESST
ncbi:asparaginase family protein [Aspergillus steynii IBT 23096]|uniref:Asparaginase family protein n=1 Tax=Aspergillus steynii IBT 23096 TaxID=1392250 RepID=A0A2I2G301_9EURO|nr:asparaginase family protein [Aspergillus steynii IBT 23096]PLB47255.1 asparaginase family protein [Aspergillus steynii IBT 23096]